MTQDNTIRAWRDTEYRASLTAAERAQLPEHPAGLIELSDADLDVVSGGSYNCGTGKACPSTMISQLHL